MELKNNCISLLLRIFLIFLLAIIAIVVGSISASAQNNFQVIPPSGCGSVIANFQNLQSTGGYVPVPQQTTGYTCQWDFGNGQTSSAFHPSGILFPALGTYDISYQLTIDTVGYVLTGVDVTAVACDDPFSGAPDMYIIVMDGSNQIVFTTQSTVLNDVFPPVTWQPNVLLSNPPYFFWIWDEDSWDSDDNCVNNNESVPGISTPIPLPANTSANFGMTSLTSLNGGLQFTLHYFKEVSVITEQYTYIVHELPASPQLNVVNAWYCEGQEIPPVTALTQQGHYANWYSDPNLNYFLATGDSYTFIQPPNGTYELYVTQTDTATGCESLPAHATVTIGPLPAPYVYNGNKIFCVGEQLPDLYSDGNLITWYADQALTNLLHTGDTLELDLEFPGVYHYWVVNEDVSGCISEAAHVTVTIAPLLEAEFLTNPVSCAGHNDGSAIISMLNGYPPYQFYWSNGQQNTTSASNLPAGTVSVTVMDSAFCVRSFLTEIDDATPITFAASVVGVSCLENGTLGSIALDIAGGSPPYELIWSNGMQGTFISGLQQGAYSMLLTDSKQCTRDSVFSVGMLDDCVIIATVLTPNDDGYNDTWAIQSAEFFPDAVIRVYDRNGSVVFESMGLYQPWDGTFKGTILPTGSYFYYVQLAPSMEPLTGTVDIIR